MNVKMQSLRGPFNKFHNNDKLKSMTYADTDHVPYNKRKGSVNSRVDVAMDRHSEAGWVTVSITETTTTENKTSSRTISFTLDKETANKIGMYLKHEI